MVQLNQQKLLEEVLEIAKNTGEILVSYFELEHEYNMKPKIGITGYQGDFATEADTKAEDYIVDQLRMLRPNDKFVAEENGTYEPESGIEPEYIWYIDPLDGTINYSRGDSNFAVSIALKRASDNKIILGVVHAPLLHKTWFSTEELGYSYVRIKNETHSLPKLTDKRGKVISLGFGHNLDVTTKIANNIPNIFSRFSSIRKLGSCAIELCLIADGTYDAHLSSSVYLWDFSAAEIILLNSEKKFRKNSIDGNYRYSLVVSDEEDFDFLNQIL